MSVQDLESCHRKPLPYRECMTGKRHHAGGFKEETSHDQCPGSVWRQTGQGSQALAIRPSMLKKG